MPRKPKAPRPEAPAPAAPQVNHYTREDALALKPNYNLSCFQEAGTDWRLIYTKALGTTWVVGTMDSLGLHEEPTQYTSELEANQRFHELRQGWAPAVQSGGE